MDFIIKPNDIIGHKLSSIMKEGMTLVGRVINEKLLFFYNMARLRESKK